jgi:hypothetical protein
MALTWHKCDILARLMVSHLCSQYDPLIAVQLQHRSVQLQPHIRNTVRKREFRNLDKATETHVLEIEFLSLLNSVSSVSIVFIDVFGCRSACVL